MQTLKIIFCCAYEKTFKMVYPSKISPKNRAWSRKTTEKDSILEKDLILNT